MFDAKPVDIAALQSRHHLPGAQRGIRPRPANTRYSIHVRPAGTASCNRRLHTAEFPPDFAVNPVETLWLSSHAASGF